MKYIFSITIFLFILISEVFTQNSVIDSLLEIVDNKKNKEKIDVLNQISAELCLEGEYENSKFYADSALILSKELKYKFGEAEALKNIAEYFYELEISDNSADYYLKAYEIYKELKDSVNMAYCTNVAGICFRDIFQYDKAIEYHLLSLRIAEECKNSYRISSALYSLGYLYHNLLDYDKALDYYVKSMNIDLEINDEKGLGSDYINIGLVYFDKNDYKTAIEYFQKAYDIYTKLDDISGLAIVVNNFGLVYQKTNLQKQAILYFYKSIYYEKLQNNDEGIASSYSSIADSYELMNELDSAIKFHNAALKITKDLELKQMIYKGLFNIYKKKFDYKNSLYYHELLLAVKDTIFNQEKLKQVADMQTKYDTQKKEDEIRNLTTQKQIQDITLKKNRILLYAAIIGIILLLGLAVVILYALKLKQKANTKLKEQNIQILQQKEEILAQRDEIEKKNEELIVLNASLFQQKEEIRAQAENLEEANVEITKQKNIIEKIHMQTSASINYAKLIQDAVLPKEDFIKSLFADFMLLYKPKDIVSGDFYFAKNFKNYTFLAVADCTGHGVPGAFMSMLGVALLNDIIRKTEIQNPAAVLEDLRIQIKYSLQQTGDINEQQDGMDIAFVTINNNSKMLSYAGAHNPLYIYRQNQFFEFKADKMPVGIYYQEHPYTFYDFQLQKNDRIYLFSDGYFSQFKEGTKETMKIKRFKDLLEEIHNLSLKEQKQKLEYFLNDWKGDQVQVDDILILAVEI